MIRSTFFFFFFQAEDGIRDLYVTGVQTCALPICRERRPRNLLLHGTLILRKNRASPSRLSGVGRRDKEIAKRMSMPKTMSPVETVDLINLSSLTVEEETPTLTTAQPRPALPSRVAVVGNYLPRQCGIATFTTDLCGALSAEYGAIDLLALPVNDTEAGYSYPARVRFELSEGNLASYRRAANFLNFGNVDIVCLPHEYGIFGGRAGSHILELLRHLQMPFVTTLHTVLREPDTDQRIVMAEKAT